MSYLLPFTVLFRCLVDVSHHPAFSLSMSPPLPLLLVFPHTSLHAQSSHKSPNSTLHPLHLIGLSRPVRQRKIVSTWHHYHEKRLLSVHVLQSKILLVQWQTRYGHMMLHPILNCYRSPEAVMMSFEMCSGILGKQRQGAGDWRGGWGGSYLHWNNLLLPESDCMTQTFFLSLFLSLCLSLSLMQNTYYTHARTHTHTHTQLCLQWNQSIWSHAGKWQLAKMSYLCQTVLNL